MKSLPESDAEILREIALTNQPGEGDWDDDQIPDDAWDDDAILSAREEPDVIQRNMTSVSGEWLLQAYRAIFGGDDTDTAGPGLDGLDLGGGW